MTLVTAAALLAVCATSAFASWTRLGGDPLFPGGIKGKPGTQVHRNDFVRKMKSKKGQKAMRLALKNRSELTAVNRAISTGQFKKCTLRYGDRFVAESFGAGTVLVDRNVTFRDPRYRTKGAPAYCMAVVVGGKAGKYVLRIKVPWICVNFGVMEREKLPQPPPEKPVQPQPTPTPAPGQPAPTPVPGKPKPPTPTPTPVPEKPQPTPTPPPPPPANKPPMVKLANSPQHVFEKTGTTQICAEATDPEGDSLTVKFTVATGQVTDAYQPDLARQGRWCTKYSAFDLPVGVESMYEVIQVAVSDGKHTIGPVGIIIDANGQPVTGTYDVASFPVIKDQFKKLTVAQVDLLFQNVTLTPLDKRDLALAGI